MPPRGGPGKLSPARGGRGATARLLGLGGRAGYSGAVQGWLQWGGLFVAGGGGCCLRHLLAQRVDVALTAAMGERAWPHAGVLVVNLVGCLAIGALAAALPAGPWRTIVLVGLLGGFTTYSTFALLSVELASAGRWAPLAWQLGLHLIGGMLMVALGAALVGLISTGR